MKDIYFVRYIFSRNPSLLDEFPLIFWFLGSNATPSLKCNLFREILVNAILSIENKNHYTQFAIYLIQHFSPLINQNNCPIDIYSLVFKGLKENPSSYMDYAIIDLILVNPRLRPLAVGFYTSATLTRLGESLMTTLLHFEGKIQIQDEKGRPIKIVRKEMLMQHLNVMNFLTNAMRRSHFEYGYELLILHIKDKNFPAIKEHLIEPECASFFTRLKDNETCPFHLICTDSKLRDNFMLYWVVQLMSGKFDHFINFFNKNNFNQVIHAKGSLPVILWFYFINNKFGMKIVNMCLNHSTARDDFLQGISQPALEFKNEITTTDTTTDILFFILFINEMNVLKKIIQYHDAIPSMYSHFYERKLSAACDHATLFELMINTLNSFIKDQDKLQMLKIICVLLERIPQGASHLSTSKEIDRNHLLYCYLQQSPAKITQRFLNAVESNKTLTGELANRYHIKAMGPSALSLHSLFNPTGYILDDLPSECEEEIPPSPKPFKSKEGN